MPVVNVMHWRWSRAGDRKYHLSDSYVTMCPLEGQTYLEAFKARAAENPQYRETEFHQIEQLLVFK